MIEIAHLPDRRHAIEVNQSDLARGQADVRVIALLGQKLRRASGTAHKLPALSRTQLDVMDGRPHRDISERQRIAHENIRIGAGDDRLPHLQPMWRQDIPLLPIRIMEQGDEGRPIRIILDRGHARRDAELVPLEINDAIEALMPSTAMADRDMPVVVSTVNPPLADRQRLVRLLGRDLLLGQEGLKPPRRIHRCDRLDPHTDLLSGQPFRPAPCTR